MSHDILPVVSGNNLRKIWQKLLATFPTRTQVITLIEENAKLKKEVVQELPTENINTNCIYLVPDPNGTARNVYNEYMYIIDEQTQQGNWELIGTTRVDMTQYYTKTQTDRMLLDKQNRTDNDLPTESKTITGAISEIYEWVSDFISSARTAITSLINRVTKLEPIEGTTADILQKFNDGEIPEGRYAESWDDDVAEFAIETTSEQYGALTEAQQKAFNYLITDGLPGGMLLMDNYPREGSNNAVKSKGLYTKFEEINTHFTNVEKRVDNNNLGNSVTIPVDGTEYTSPSDGYIQLHGVEGTAIIYTLKSASNNNAVSNVIRCWGGAWYYTIFVRKGMRISVTASRGAFLPLE